MNKITLLGLSATFALFATMPAVAAQAAQKAAPADSHAEGWKYKTPKLGRDEFDKLLAKPRKIVIIDVRRPDELTRNGGFPAYLSIQLKDLEKYLAYIPRERRVITVSNHANRAGAAGDLLAARGFKVAGAVGAQTYEQEGGNLLKIAPVTRKIAALPSGPHR